MVCLMSQIKFLLLHRSDLAMRPNMIDAAEAGYNQVSVS